MRQLLLILAIILPTFAFAQCNEETKAKVDELKNSITYPKYNIGDILYIAFINGPDVDGRYLQDKDIDVIKVKIQDISVINGHNFRSAGDGSGLFLGFNASKIEWTYQYVDASIANPKYSDLSDKFHSESRFSKTREGAIKILKESNKESASR